MKLYSESLLLLLTLLLPMLEAQFSFPRIPSPPQVLFGGFRPFFSSRTRRPPRRPPPFVFQRPAISSHPNAITQNFLTRAPGFHRPVAPTRTSFASVPATANFQGPLIHSGGNVNFRTSRPHQQQHQTQHRPANKQIIRLEPIEIKGFGAPKPQSIITPFPQGSPKQQKQQHQQQQHQQQHQHQQQQQQQHQEQIRQLKPQVHRPFIEDQFFHRPINFLSNNNIIGLIPPPLPLPFQTRPNFRPRPSSTVPILHSPPPNQSRPPVKTTHLPSFKITRPQPSHIPIRPIQSHSTIKTRPQPSHIPVRPQQQHQQQQQQKHPQSQIQHARPIFEQLDVPAHTPVQTTPDFQFQFVPLSSLPRRPNILPPLTNSVSAAHRPQKQNIDAIDAFKPSDLSSIGKFNSINSISSNSIEDLIINKVPAVNAGVLPLAHEKPTKMELFPPFTRRG